MIHCMQRATTFYAIPPCVHEVESPRLAPRPSPARPRPCVIPTTAVLVPRRADWSFCMAERTQRCTYMCGVYACTINHHACTQGMGRNRTKCSNRSVPVDAQSLIK